MIINCSVRACDKLWIEQIIAMDESIHLITKRLTDVPSENVDLLRVVSFPFFSHFDLFSWTRKESEKRVAQDAPLFFISSFDAMKICSNCSVVNFF